MVARSVTSAKKNYVPTHSIYKMLLAEGLKQQEPTVHGRRLSLSFLKNLPQALSLFCLHGREQFGSPLALVGIFVAGDDALERRDR